jgi:hypothetical protein
MRDIHGRYSETKPVEDYAPEWAVGCEHCVYGIASAPDLTGAVSISMERLVQAIDKDLVFCACTAGVRYRNYLRNLHQKLIEEARRLPMMQEQTGRNTHPDIEMSRQKIIAVHLQAPAPTMHMEGALA